MPVSILPSIDVRCEDYPCCGHAGDPGGCPDFETVVTCKGCKVKFHPDALSYNYCYGCQAQSEVRREVWDY